MTVYQTLPNLPSTTTAAIYWPSTILLQRCESNKDAVILTSLAIEDIADEGWITRDKITN